MRPSIDELLPKVDSKYSMVVAAAKRARQLVEGAPETVKSKSTKPVSIALEELAQGKLTYQRTRSGIK